MKKFLKNSKYESIFVFILIIALSICVLTACIIGIGVLWNGMCAGTDLSDVYVGTWASNNTENPLAITLNSDYTGYIETPEIRYTFTWTSTLVPSQINVLIASDPIHLKVDLKNKVMYFFQNYHSEAIPLFKSSPCENK